MGGALKFQYHMKFKNGNNHTYLTGLLGQLSKILQMLSRYRFPPLSKKYSIPMNPMRGSEEALTIN